MELLQPTEKYVNYVYKSANYLNCPTFLFNSDLDSMYRHGCMEEKEVENVAWFLKLCNYPKPIESAKKFVEQRKKISLKKFNKLNVNKYIDNTPPHIEQKHKDINNWYEKNTKVIWRFGEIVYKSQPSYPFQRSINPLF